LGFELSAQPMTDALGSYFHRHALERIILKELKCSDEHLSRS